MACWSWQPVARRALLPGGFFARGPTGNGVPPVTPACVPARKGIYLPRLGEVQVERRERTLAVRLENSNDLCFPKWRSELVKCQRQHG